MDDAVLPIESVGTTPGHDRVRTMRILITNDDGIHAPGLDACEEIARALSDDVWVVAPETDQSGVSHSLSLNDPLRLREVGERHFAVKGTPTDCVIMGARHIMKDVPDLVLSGVNRGRNAAEDVTYSGTVAGAMEGTVLGIPSFALSQAYSLRDQAAAATGRPRSSTRPTSSAACSRRACRATCWSTSIFPDCPPDEVKGIAVATQGKRDQELLRIDARHDGRGNPYYWIAFARGVRRPARTGTDLARARREPHRGDAAAARPDRRAVHDAARGDVRLGLRIRLSALAGRASRSQRASSAGRPGTASAAPGGRGRVRAGCARRSR